MTNDSCQINYQYGELDESHNFSNHLCLVVCLIPPKKYEGPIPYLELVILFVILLTVLETLGNFLLLCIIR